MLLNDRGRCGNQLSDPKPLGRARNMRICAAGCDKFNGCIYFQWYNNKTDVDNAFMCSQIELSDSSCPKKMGVVSEKTNSWELNIHWHTGKLGTMNADMINYPPKCNYFFAFCVQ